MTALDKNFREIEPYIPGEQPEAVEGLIKLNTNENPYPPSPLVKKAAAKLSCEHLRLYPSPSAEPLTGALAEYYGRGREEVFTGTGSDDVLATAFLAFFNSGKPILFPDITYSFYQVWAGLFRIPFETPGLDENFRIRPGDYYRENGGVVLANPNAPTGIYEELDLVEDILRHNRDVVVIVDEAYIDFGGTSARALLNRYENLLVVGTFSKSRSLAGLRIGYALGSPVLIRELLAVKNSYNSYTMNLPSICLGCASLKDDVYYHEVLDKIIRTRERAKEEMRSLGFTFPDSRANFLFVRHEAIAARELFAALRKENIIVRYFDKPGQENYLRITIGTDGEMDSLFSFLKAYRKERMV